MVGRYETPAPGGDPVETVAVEVVTAGAGGASITQPGGGAASGPAGGDLSGTYPDPAVAKVPSAALAAGTRVTIATVTGRAEITAAVQTATGAAGGDLSGTYPDPTVAKVPSAALTAGTNVTITTVTGKAEIAATGSATLTHATAWLATIKTIAANTATELVSVSLAAGTWLVLGQATIQTPSSSTLTRISLVVTKTSASIVTSLGAANSGLLVSGSNRLTSLAFSCVVTVAATTTLYLNIESQGAATVEAQGTPGAVPHVTGLVAIKL